MLIVPTQLFKNTAEFGLPEILVTDNRTEFINNEIQTFCHLYSIKHKPRTSHALWTKGLVEGMNRSLHEYHRCIIKWKRYKKDGMVNRCKVIHTSLVFSNNNSWNITKKCTRFLST